MPGYVPNRALIKPAFEACPFQRVVTAMITPGEVVENSRELVTALETPNIPSLFFDLFCMKQVIVASLSGNKRAVLSQQVVDPVSFLLVRDTKRS